jgi:hypothetical protein
VAAFFLSWAAWLALGGADTLPFSGALQARSDLRGDLFASLRLLMPLARAPVRSFGICLCARPISKSFTPNDKTNLAPLSPFLHLMLLIILGARLHTDRRARWAARCHFGDH